MIVCFTALAFGCQLTSSVEVDKWELNIEIKDKMQQA